MTDLTHRTSMPAAALAGELPTVPELQQMSTQTLRAELAQSLTMTARHLRRLAVIWRELESRGEDLTDLRTGLAIYLPQVASGQLSADAVIRYAGQPLLLRSIATLPPQDQDRLAAGQTVEVLSAGPDGTWTTTRISAHAITASQARLLIGPGHIRSTEEQRAQLEAERVAAARRRRPAQRARVRYDARADVIRVGNASASVGEILQALTDATAGQDIGDATADDLTAGIVAKLTPAEHKQLKIRATEADLSLQDYCRRLLVTRSLAI